MLCFHAWVYTSGNGTLEAGAGPYGPYYGGP